MLEEATRKSEAPIQNFCVDDCKLLRFPHPIDKSNIVTLESAKRIPFEIKRVFWLYNLPKTAYRANHAMKTTEEVVIAVKGGFDVELDDGVEKRSFILNKPDYGLHIRPMVWRTLKNFSPNTIILAFASKKFDRDDYVSVYGAFKEMILNDSSENAIRSRQF